MSRLTRVIAPLSGNAELDISVVIDLDGLMEGGAGA